MIQYFGILNLKIILSLISKSESNIMKKQKKISKTTKVIVTLYGSLALTGVGHGTLNACVYGLSGFDAETIDLTLNPLEKIKSEKRLLLAGKKNLSFDFDKDSILEKTTFLKEHSNGMKFSAFDKEGKFFFFFHKNPLN